MLRLIVLCLTLITASNSASAVDHVIGSSVCTNPSCNCIDCQCDPCTCAPAVKPVVRKVSSAVYGKPKPVNMEGQRFIVAVDQPPATENYLRALAKDNGYRFWSRVSEPGLPPGVHECEIYNGEICFSDARLTARPKSAGLVSRQVSSSQVTAAQAGYGGVTYRAVSPPAAPQSYVCGPNGCFPASQAPSYFYGGEVYSDGGGCASGNCGASSYSGFGSGLFFGSGGSGGCATCR